MSRVLFLAFQLGPGGVVTHMASLATGLLSQGWQVGIVSRGKFGEHDRGPEWFESLGVRHYQLPFPPLRLRVHSVTCGAKTIIKLRTIVREFRPDLLHIHWRSVGVFANLVRLTDNIPFVTTLHSRLPPPNFLGRIMSFWGDGAIAISKESCEQLMEDFRLPSGKVRLVYSGADDQHFRPPNEKERLEARRKFGVPSGVKIVSLIGSPYQLKGHGILIRALTKLRVEGEKVVALFAGDEKEKDSLSRLASDAGLAASVYPLGYADSRDVLWASDAFALPSRREGLPLVIIEAMLCGVVPVRTPAGGAFDQIDDGVNGFIVPFDDPAALAERLRVLLSDNALRSKMSSAALETARKKFTARRMVADTIDVYESVLKMRSGGNWTS